MTDHARDARELLAAEYDASGMPTLAVAVRNGNVLADTLTGASLRVIEKALAQSAEDSGSLREQAGAWELVFNTLQEVSPGWCDSTTRAQDSAIAAIRKLAQPAAAGAVNAVMRVSVSNGGHAVDVLWHDVDIGDGEHFLYIHSPRDVGEGFVVVPREPTDAMLDSARIALGVEQDDFEIDDARTAYDAMLTAAPGEWPP